MTTGKGKEGDWDCGSCHTRNYVFRSLYNRYKQPRILVDTNTPAHSKWLPASATGSAPCKKCNVPLPSVVSSVDTSIVPDMFSTLGTKRPASEEFSTKKR